MPVVSLWPWTTPTALSCDLECPPNRGRFNVTVQPVGDRDHDLRHYGPGKFSTILDSLVWNLTLDGCDDELGSVEEDGVWFGRLNAPLFTDETWSIMTEAEREFVRLNGAGAILSEDSNGFVYVEYFATTSALTIAWATLQVRSGLEYVPLAEEV